MIVLYFLLHYAEEIKLPQVLVDLSAIIVWVNNFETPKFQAILSNCFVRVMILHVW